MNFFYISGRFNKLSLLQDEKFIALDKTLQRTIEPLLRHLVDINTRLNSISSQHVACESAGESRKVAPGLSISDPTNCGTEAEMHEKINSALLDALDFASRTHRQQEIAEAHQRTFSWIFNNQGGDGNGHVTPGGERRPWSNFIEWLREERTPRGIYWMNGKAGSGKSTLMRFVANHVETQRHLKHWAGNADLQVSSFFFWNSGTGLQHSRPGLLRSLLFETLKTRPDLTRKLFKADLVEWKELTETYERHAIINPQVWPFFDRWLEQAFSRLIRFASCDFKLCFFIDGLDESKAEPEELVCLINETARSPFVKICVSSRPWLVFEEAFGLDSSLRLQDLTSSDIQLYVREKLQRDPKMERLETTNPNGARSLVRNIVTKANGVFLWVRIVTKSLLDGLRNWDDFSDLQRRLDELPSDLNALYSHMLDRIEPRYFFQASKIFRIFDAASALNLRPTILELDLAVTAKYSTATAPSAVEPSDAELEYCFQRMNAHLKSRCEGLLEAHDIYDRHWESLSGEETQESIPLVYRPEARLKKLKACWKVSYLHRTVKDFLDTPSVRGRLETAFDNKAFSDESFDPYLSLLMSYNINLKQGLRSYYYDSESWEETRIRKTAMDVIKIAGKLDQWNRQVLKMLHTFRILTLQWWDTSSLSEAKALPVEWDEEFLALATWHGLWAFVDEMIQRPTQLLEKERWPSPLRLALSIVPFLGVRRSLSWIEQRELHRLTPAMVELLLTRGSDPNVVIDHLGLSTWQEFLTNIYRGEFPDKNSQTYYARCFDVVKLLLEHGADVGSGRRGDSESRFSAVTIDEVIDNMFSVRLPEKADELRSLVQQKRSSRKRKVSPEDTQLPSKRQVT